MQEIMAPKFEEMFTSESKTYDLILDKIKAHTEDQISFSYENLLALFCHFSLLHNTQAQVLRSLMKMFGSLCAAEIKPPAKPASSLLNEKTEPEKKKNSDYFDFIQYSPEPLNQQEKTREKKQNELSAGKRLIVNNKDQQKEKFKKEFQKHRQKLQKEPKMSESFELQLQHINSKPKITPVHSAQNFHQPEPNKKVYREPARTKQDRETLEGQFCADCERFYQNFSQESQISTWKQMCSRHRTNQTIMQERLLFTPES